MRKSTLSRFNSDQGAENYKKKFDRKLTEQAKNHSEQRLIEQKIADLPKTTGGHCVLDMPSGVGRFYPVLKKHFPRVLQADWSGPMLQVARENLAPDAAGYFRMSALELPFRDKQFPLVFSVRLCHHLPTAEERRRYLQEILRVSHGWVVMSFLDTFSPHNLHRSFWRWLQGKPLKWHISDEEVADIAESQGFAVVSSSLLSRLFSGQRYAVLLRVAEAPQCSEVSNAQQEAADSSVSKADDVKASEPLVVAACNPKPTITERIFKHIHVWRGVVIGLLLAVCLFLDIGSVEMDSVVLSLGTGLGAAGAILHVWAEMHRNYRLRSGKPFATTGPYRWVRHPLYLGNLLFVTGLAVFAETLYLAPLVFAVSAILYGISAKREESRLGRLCGRTYDEYRKAVPAWIPVSPIEDSADLSSATVRGGLRKLCLFALAFVPFVLMELYFT